MRFILPIIFSSSLANNIVCDTVEGKVCSQEEIRVVKKVYGVDNCFKLCDETEQCAFFGYVTDIFQAAMRCGRACRYGLFDCYLYTEEACAEFSDDPAMNIFEKATCTNAVDAQDMTCYGQRLFDTSKESKSYRENGCWVKDMEDGECYIGNPDCANTDCSGTTINTQIRIDVFTEDPENDWPTIEEDFMRQEWLIL